jgi:hypothetical protein
MAKCVPHTQQGTLVGYYIWCQGCKCAHYFPVETNLPNVTSPKPTKPTWTFKGNLERPTFTPSLRHFYHKPASHGEQAGQEVTTCHIVVTDGRIQFCNDCPFALKGQTLDLEEIPADYGLPPNT